MIIVTGAEGFIGSCLVSMLNQQGYYDLALVDDFNTWPTREKNLLGKKYSYKINRVNLFSWFEEHANEIEFVFHIGARTDTTEKDEQIFKELNLDYSKQLYNLCVKHGVAMVFASSAATYGNGDFGYNDDHTLLDKLKPMNPYGQSKHDFDRWALAQEKQPYFWAGLKFFNVYGPNEYHKGRMASVVLHAYKQIKETGKVNLFMSHRNDYENGEQKRDFIYVKDLCDVCIWLMHHRKNSGIYNLGSGTARSWNSLANAIFSAAGVEPNISYVPIPEDIRETYQYFTEANMQKLKSIGYQRPFTSIEDAVKDYVTHYLASESYL